MMIERIKKLRFIQGAIAAISLLTLLQSATPITAFDALRVMHTTIVGWRQITGAIGAWIGSWIYLPALSAGEVNFFLLLATFYIPYGYTEVKEFRVRLRTLRELRTLEQRTREAYQRLLDAIRYLACQISDMQSELEARGFDAEANVESIRSANSKIQDIASLHDKTGAAAQRSLIGISASENILLAFCLLYGASLALEDSASISSIEFGMRLILLAASITIPLIRICAAYPRYKSGFLFLLGSVVTFEFLYFMHMPVVKDSVDRYLCAFAGSAC
jgi:hypothetical protein